jgi:hypothetical protein
MIFIPRLKRAYIQKGEPRRQKNQDSEGSLFKDEKQGDPDIASKEKGGGRSKRRGLDEISGFKFICKRDYWPSKKSTLFFSTDLI